MLAKNASDQPPRDEAKVPERTEVPLIEQLRSVHKDWYAIREVGHYASRSIPYGEFCYKAADEIDRLTRALASRDADIAELKHRLECANANNARKFKPILDTDYGRP